MLTLHFLHHTVEARNPSATWDHTCTASGMSQQGCRNLSGSCLSQGWLASVGLDIWGEASLNEAKRGTSMRGKRKPHKCESQSRVDRVGCSSLALLSFLRTLLSLLDALRFLAVSPLPYPESHSLHAAHTGACENLDHPVPESP